MSTTAFKFWSPAGFHRRIPAAAPEVDPHQPRDRGNVLVPCCPPSLGCRASLIAGRSSLMLMLEPEEPDALLVICSELACESPGCVWTGRSFAVWLRWFLRCASGECCLETSDTRLVRDSQTLECVISIAALDAAHAGHLPCAITHKEGSLIARNNRNSVRPAEVSHRHTRTCWTVSMLDLLE